MIGFTPVFCVCLKSCTAPAIEPWSVSVTAGISSSAARATRSGMRHAPSRIEYSEWTWRWTNDAAISARLLTRYDDFEKRGTCEFLRRGRVGIDRRGLLSAAFRHAAASVDRFGAGVGGGEAAVGRRERGVEPGRE